MSSLTHCNIQWYTVVIVASTKWAWEFFKERHFNMSVGGFLWNQTIDAKLQVWLSVYHTFICKKYRDYHLVFGHNSRTEQAFCIFLNLAFIPPMQHCKSKSEKIITIKSLNVVQQDSRNEVVGKGRLVRFHSSEHARDQKSEIKLSLCTYYSHLVKSTRCTVCQN